MSQNIYKMPVKDKWTPEQVIHLLEVYAGEEPLYKTSSPEYHNRRIRGQCLERVVNSVRELRPGTTVEDIVKKIHSLRNGFNTEHKKVINSKRSGAGTDNVYTPTLFYYTKALFFAEYFVSRKSHSTKIGEINEDGNTQSTVFSSTMLESTQDSETLNRKHCLMDHDDYTLPGPSSRSRTTSIGNNSMDGELECSQVIDLDYSEEVITVAPSPSDANTQSLRQHENGSQATCEHESFNQPPELPFRRPASPSATSSSSSSSSGRRRKRAHSPTAHYEKLLLYTLKEKPVEPPKDDPIHSFLEFVGGVLRKLPSGEQDKLMQSIFTEVMSKKATYSLQL